MGAVIYTRVSTGKQQDNGVSLEAQEKKAVEYCEKHNLFIDGIYSDSISGSNAQRPEFIEALTRAKVLKAPLIVYNTSRFARDTIDSLIIERELRKAGSELVSLTDTVDTKTPQGEAMFAMMSAFNQMERRLIGERTKMAMQHMKRQGKRVGSIPYGYKLVENGLVENESEQKMIQTAKRLKRKGLSFRKISNALADKGIYNRLGNPFGAQTISNILNYEHTQKETLAK